MARASSRPAGSLNPQFQAPPTGIQLSGTGVSRAVATPRRIQEDRRVGPKPPGNGVRCLFPPTSPHFSLSKASSHFNDWFLLGLNLFLTNFVSANYTRQMPVVSILKTPAALRPCTLTQYDSTSDRGCTEYVAGNRLNRCRSNLSPRPFPDRLPECSLLTS